VFLFLVVRKTTGIPVLTATHACMQVCLLERSDWLFAGMPVNDNMCISHAELAIILMTANPKTTTPSAEQTGKLTSGKRLIGVTKISIAALSV